MSSIEKYISELPNVLNHSSSQYGFYDIYCYILYVEMPFKGPLRLFITDFTSNSNISNPNYTKEIDIENTTIEDNKILRIDVFPDKLDQVIKAYSSHTGRHFFNDLNSQFDAFTRKYAIFDKMWIVKLTISLKKYNETIEARMKFIQNIGPIDTSPRLTTLYKSIMDLPAQFLIECKKEIKQFIPLEIQSNLKVALAEKELANANRLNDSHNSQPAQSRSSQPNISQKKTTSTKVKMELLSDDIVPDTLFGNDYAISSPLQSDSEELFFNDKRQSFRELNSELNNPLNNRIYKIEAYIQEVTPKDWSYVCVKGYENSYITKKLELTDPFIRSLELIITEQKLESDNMIVLDPSEYLTIHLDGPQIAEFFKIEELENLYTHASKFNELFYLNKNKVPLKLDLYKKSLKINQNEEILVWSVKRLSIDDFGIDSLL